MFTTKKAKEYFLKSMYVQLTGIMLITGCQRPSESRTYASGGDLSYRVDFFRGKGALDSSSTAVYAVLKTSAGSSQKLVLSGTDIDIQSIAWQSDGQGAICLTGGYTDTYKRIVALTVEEVTRAVYTHLSDSCVK